AGQEGLNMTEQRRSHDHPDRAAPTGKPHTDNRGVGGVCSVSSGRGTRRFGLQGMSPDTGPAERDRPCSTITDRIHVGNGVDLLRELPAMSVNLVITSPIRYRQRRYTDGPREIGRAAKPHQMVTGSPGFQPTTSPGSSGLGSGPDRGRDPVSQSHPG